MIRGLAVALVVLVAGCGDRRHDLEVGDRLSLGTRADHPSPLACGTPFPWVVEIDTARFDHNYLVDCPDTGPIWVSGFPPADRFDLAVGWTAWTFRAQVWAVIAIAVLGLLLPLGDPLRLRALRDRLAAARARAAPGADARLAPLRCTTCGAAVPLVDADSAPCHHCAGDVAVPADHRAIARARAAAAVDHAAWLRVWRVHGRLTRVLASPWTIAVTPRRTRW